MRLFDRGCRLQHIMDVTGLDRAGVVKALKKRSEIQRVIYDETHPKCWRHLQGSVVVI